MTLDDANLPDATDLRRKLDQAETLAAQSQLRDITTKITRAIDLGQSSITLRERLHAGVEKVLQAKHYTVKDESGSDMRDQTSWTIIVISW